MEFVVACGCSRGPPLESLAAHGAVVHFGLVKGFCRVTRLRCLKAYLRQDTFLVTAQVRGFLDTLPERVVVLRLTEAFGGETFGRFTGGHTIGTLLLGTPVFDASERINTTLYFI